MEVKASEQDTGTNLHGLTLQGADDLNRGRANSTNSSYLTLKKIASNISIS